MRRKTEFSIVDKRTLLRAAIDLGARSIAGRSSKEDSLVTMALSVPKTDKAMLKILEHAIGNLEDPLGCAWGKLRALSQKRKVGSFYTPRDLIKPMIAWLLKHGAERVVDVACGSGRFAAEVAATNSQIKLVAVDSDPVATIIARATLNVLGANRAKVVNGDFLTTCLPDFSGRTGFVSNPPYVRFQALSKRHKAIGQTMARNLDHKISGLSGLHAYFFLGVARSSKSGDIGCFLTSAEWTENSYGQIVRDLLLNGLGGESVRIVDPKVYAFSGIRTTAAIACFRAGVDAKGLHIGQVATIDETHDLDSQESMTFYDREFLIKQSDWKQARRERAAEAYVEGPTIGDLFRVSRGTATGANKFFAVIRSDAQRAGIEDFVVPVLSSARELPRERRELRASDVHKFLISVPRAVDRKTFPALDRYLRRGEVIGENGKAICQRTLARTRKPWWSIEPALPPIIVSYMAQKPPSFYFNRDRLPILNIAHGLYPKRQFSNAQLKEVVGALNEQGQQYFAWGRTYHGDLKKFEPGEIQSLPLPASLTKFL